MLKLRRINSDDWQLWRQVRLAALTEALGDHPGTYRFHPQSPNLFWPDDRAWCVASEIDFDSTLIGGTTELVDTILNDPTFDAWPVHPDDSLAADADLINNVP